MSSKEINWPDPSTLEWDRRKADLRNEPRTMIRVNVLPANGQHIGSFRAKHGEQFMLVYKSDLVAAKKLLPTDAERARLAQAKERYEALFEAEVERHGGRGATGTDRDRAIETAHKTIAASVWSEYHRLANPIPERSPVRAYPPLESLDVWPGEVDAPSTPEGVAEAQSDRMTESFTKALEKLAALITGGHQAKAR
jgi:hypothetical protein